MVVGGAADDPDSATALLGNGSVVLDTAVTPALAAEGLARDLVRVVQQARRNAGLDISDRIRLGVDAGDDVNDAVETHHEMIAAETLATVIELGAAVPGRRLRRRRGRRWLQGAGDRGAHRVSRTGDRA